MPHMSRSAFNFEPFRRGLRQALFGVPQDGPASLRGGGAILRRMPHAAGSDKSTPSIYESLDQHICKGRKPDSGSQYDEKGTNASAARDCVWGRNGFTERSRRLEAAIRGSAREFREEVRGTERGGRP